jgi:alpha-glucosidase
MRGRHFFTMWAEKMRAGRGECPAVKTRRGGRAVILSVVALLISISPTAGQWQRIGSARSVVREARGVMLDCQNALLRVTVLAADLIRVRMQPGRSFGPDESWAVVRTDWPAVPLEVSESRSSVRLTTPELIVEIGKQPCRVIIRDSRGEIISEDAPGKGMSWSGTEVRVWKTMPPDEYYYGLGERAGPLEHRGRTYVNWNTDAYGYQRGTDPLYQSIPFLLALRRGRSYGIFFDNTYRSSFDLGAARRDEYSFGAEDGELNYYFFYGPDPKKVISRFTDLVGRMPLPPKWALGYQQSRWSYEPESRVREIAREFRRRQIPCDVIYLDIDYMDGFRSFTIDRRKFPTFSRMISDLAAIGMKVVAIVDPGIKKEPGYGVYDEGVKGNHFVRMPDGSLYTGAVWPGLCVFPDFTREETRRWWGDLYKELVEAGVKGFWNDMNEPAVFVETDRHVDRTMSLDAIHEGHSQPADHRKVHNVYGMLMARATYEGLKRLRPGERPFVLTRASYAGGHRYAATWTGDNTSSWDHLSLWIPMVLNLGLSGQPFAGPDIGGFTGVPTAELYTRFLQAGVFSPFCRTHAQKGKPDQEPWSFGPEYEAINRRAIELRYRLLPYLYTVFEEAARTGVPVMRPLFLEYPEDRRTYRMDEEFLVGRDLLVAPVLTEGARSVEVYLPEGEWFDFWTGEKRVGPGQFRVGAPLDRVPLFVRGGAILPLQPVVPYVEEAPIHPLVLMIFPSRESEGALYEDDGISDAYQQGAWARTSFRARRSAEEITLEIGPRQGQYAPPPRAYLLQCVGVEREPSKVSRSGRELERSTSLAGLGHRSEGWSYDPVSKIVWVKFPDEGSAVTVTIR